MKTETFHLELIRSCFGGGSEPERQPRIRPQSLSDLSRQMGPGGEGGTP